MSIYNAIYSGKFSSDRTVQQYAKDIWYYPISKFFQIKRKIEPVHIPEPSK